MSSMDFIVFEWNFVIIFFLTNERTYAPYTLHTIRYIESSNIRSAYRLSVSQNMRKMIGLGLRDSGLFLLWLVNWCSSTK